MQASEFTARLNQLRADDFMTIASALRAERDTADSEVAWWRATLAVNASLRRQRRTREAGLAAHVASSAVIEAARGCGVLDDDRDIAIAVARAASDVARAIVAGHVPGLPVVAAEVLASPFQRVALVAA
jgi:hypothetical protein